MTTNDTAKRRLTLKRGREGAVKNRHPWIFAGAIARETGPEDAPFAVLETTEGEPLAEGLYSRSSQIRLRALTFGGAEATEQLIEQRIVGAIQRRRPLLDGQTNACRLVHAEGDELSGLIVDLYDDVAVVEIANRGLEQLRPLIVATLRRELRLRGIWFENDIPARGLEKLPLEAAWEGEGEPAARIREHGVQFHVDPRDGQKTGFFLDQRENREIGRSIARDRDVLNLFSYTGAFGAYAAKGGATRVTNVDVSAKAIDGARQNFALNGIEDRGAFEVADAFQYVRTQAVNRAQFDVVICDPPAFVKSRNDVEKAARGYKDINLYSMRLTKPGGLVMTFSCSGHMPLDLFQKVVFSAALDTGRRVSFLRRLGAGEDHPVSLYCPEGEYLKGFLLRVD